MKNTFAIVFALCLLTFSVHANAQDYVPPPMFDDPSTPTTRPQTNNGYIVEPRASPRETVPPMAPAPPITPITARTSKQSASMEPIVEPVRKSKAEKPDVAPVKKSVKPAAVPPKKPSPPVAAAAPVIPAPPPAVTQQATEPAAAPIPSVPSALPKPAPIAIDPIVAPVPKTAPASKVISKGVVTGPVSMPSVPTQAVEKHESFVDPSTNGKTEKTIMQRTQEQARAKQEELAKKKEDERLAAIAEAEPEATAPVDNAVPTEFDPTHSGVLKKIVPYQAGQIVLEEADLMGLGAGVLTELKRRDHWRIQIRSFATPQGQGVNSDRRIALSRAIAMRKSLVDQGVRASRIDVRAEGLQTNASETPDRIDLYLYSPVEKPAVF